MNSMEATFVNPKNIPYIWPEVKPLIDKALVHSIGEMISEDVLYLLLEGTEHLCIGVDEDKNILSALVGEIIQYPRKKVLRIITWSTKSGYDYDPWMVLFDTIEDFAKQNGCSGIEAWARKGLARKLKWDHQYAVLTKHLGG